MDLALQDKLVTDLILLRDKPSPFLFDLWYTWNLDAWESTGIKQEHRFMVLCAASKSNKYIIDEFLSRDNMDRKSPKHKLVMPAFFHVDDTDENITKFDWLYDQAGAFLFEIKDTLTPVPLRISTDKQFFHVNVMCLYNISNTFSKTLKITYDYAKEFLLGSIVNCNATDRQIDIWMPVLSDYVNFEFPSRYSIVLKNGRYLVKRYADLNDDIVKRGPFKFRDAMLKVNPNFNEILIYYRIEQTRAHKLLPPGVDAIVGRFVGAQKLRMR